MWRIGRSVTEISVTQQRVNSRILHSDKGHLEEVKCEQKRSDSTLRVQQTFEWVMWFFSNGSFYSWSHIIDAWIQVHPSEQVGCGISRRHNGDLLEKLTVRSKRNNSQGWELLALRPTPNLEDYPLSAVGNVRMRHAMAHS